MLAAFVEGGLVVLNRFARSLPPFTVKKLECSKQAFAVNTLAWNNRIGPGTYFVGLLGLGND